MGLDDCSFPMDFFQCSCLSVVVRIMEECAGLQECFSYLTTVNSLFHLVCPWLPLSLTVLTWRMDFCCWQ